MNATQILNSLHWFSELEFLGWGKISQNIILFPQLEQTKWLAEEQLRKMFELYSDNLLIMKILQMSSLSQNNPIETALIWFRK